MLSPRVTKEGKKCFNITLNFNWNFNLIIFADEEGHTITSAGRVFETPDLYGDFTNMEKNSFGKHTSFLSRRHNEFFCNIETCFESNLKAEHCKLSMQIEEHWIDDLKKYDKMTLMPYRRALELCTTPNPLFLKMPITVSPRSLRTNFLYLIVNYFGIRGSLM